MYIRGTDLDKKEERTFNKCSVYVNVDVQLFWKLLLPVWKATDNFKLIPHPHLTLLQVSDLAYPVTLLRDGRGLEFYKGHSPLILGA